MSAVSNRTLLTPAEWMTFYENLFKGESPLNGSFCPLNSIGMDQQERGERKQPHEIIQETGSSIAI